MGRLSGLIAAPFTALHPDGRLNLDMVDVQAEALQRNGVRGVFICGTTGEGISLTVSERMQLAERWRAAAPPGMTVIVHVGHTSLEEAKRLAAHAAEVGLPAISAMWPSPFKPRTQTDLVDMCGAVAAAAPGASFYYYHIPRLSGLDFSMADFLRAARERIPNFAGLKFTHDDLMDYGRALDVAAGELDVLYGCDEMLLSALALGAVGAVGSTYNFAAPVYHRIINAFKAGDLATAREEQVKVQHWVAVIEKYGGLPAGKAVMRMIGIDCGPPRLPLRPLNAEEYAALRRELERLGFFESIRGNSRDST